MRDDDRLKFRAFHEVRKIQNIFIRFIATAGRAGPSSKESPRTIEEYKKGRHLTQSFESFGVIQAKTYGHYGKLFFCYSSFVCNPNPNSSCTFTSTLIIRRLTPLDPAHVQLVCLWLDGSLHTEWLFCSILSGDEWGGICWEFRCMFNELQCCTLIKSEWGWRCIDLRCCFTRFSMYYRFEHGLIE